MTTFYSDHFSSDGISRTTRDPNKFPDIGLGSAKTFNKLIHVTALPTTSDIIRICSLPTSARLVDLMVSDSGVSAAGASNIGLHKSEGLGGAVVDADCFAAALAKAAARVDGLIQAGTVTKLTRGNYLWQMPVGAPTKDPNEMWDITLTPSTTFTTTANVWLFEVKYILGT